jgi:hypothetical protein
MQKILSLIKKLYFPMVALALALPLKASAFSLGGLLGGGGGGGTRAGLNKVQGEFSVGMFSEAQDVPSLIAVIIRIMLMVGGAIAVLFVIIGGYQYMTSSGNEEQAEQGRKTLTNAIIGVIIILLAWVIVNVVVNQVTQ